MATLLRQPIQDYYEILGIATNASTKEISSAYKKLALKYHPDKSGGIDSSNDEFQKIQEAAETLRDPLRRRKHDQELSRIKRVFVEECFEFDTTYTGWRPHNPMWYYGPRTASERYMYSYGNSVHMNPNSREAQEERARVENEIRFDEEVRKEHEERAVNRRDERQRAEDEVLAKARRRMAMKANVRRDEELIAEGTVLDDDSLEVCFDGEASQACSVYSDYEQSGDEGDENDFNQGEEYASDGEYENSYEDGGCDENLAEDENTEDDLISFKESEYEGVDQAGEGEEYEDHEYLEGEKLYEEQGAEDDEASSNQSTQRASLECHAPHGNPSLFDVTASKSKLSDSLYGTGREEQSEDDEFYYSFSENAHSTNGEDTTSSLLHEPTVSEDNYIRVESDLHSQLAPFISLFEAKLNHPSSQYTRADMHSELRGIVMEIFCGWLENLRVGFSEGETQGTFNDLYDTSETCDHLGYWIKEYGRDECEVCHRWKPIFALTCPSCGVKACVVCKFQR